MTSTQGHTWVLAGDVGGTKTHLGLFRQGKTRPVIKVMETCPSQEAPDLEHIIARFVARHQVTVSGACFGIAGPVIKGKCKTTNLPWVVSEAGIRKRFHWDRVRLLNDLAAMALAIPLLRSRELFPLVKGKAMADGTKVLIAPGTGLGMALLACEKGRYIPIASEGGHADFSPTTAAQVRLWQFLQKRYDHVSIERVLSGPGLVNIHAWLRDAEGMIEPAWLSDMMNRTDPAQAITDAAMTHEDPLCMAVLDMFVSIMGAVAGNMALTGLATGGVYLGGGIPPKILPRLQENGFAGAYTDKGRFREVVQGIPVRVILNEQSALLGAAGAAFESHSKKEG
ncbi:MAG: glucokinase [Desulfatiglandaceae bacterium]